ncbi:hypothetical protein CIW54_22955 [Paraburkholderia sp. T12-10]|nr:hypothetical protein CIW54_22955 [Paraburkholderia sp. T12-10]
MYEGNGIGSQAISRDGTKAVITVDGQADVKENGTQEEAMFKWLHKLTHSPQEVCARYGHGEGNVRETSGNGRFWTCDRCGFNGHTPEWR